MMPGSQVSLGLLYQSEQTSSSEPVRSCRMERSPPRNCRYESPVYGFRREDAREIGKNRVRTKSIVRLVRSNGGLHLASHSCW
jgi:hypothetical protein